MGFFDCFGFVADVVGIADIIRNKLKRSDADWKEFLWFVKKVVQAVCKDYSDFAEKSHDHKNIHFPKKDYEELLYEAVCVSLESNTPFTIEMVLPLEKEFPEGEKQRLYNLLKERLQYCFRYAMRNSQAEIQNQLQILIEHAADVLPRLNEILEITVRMEEVTEKTLRMTEDTILPILTQVRDAVILVTDTLSNDNTSVQVGVVTNDGIGEISGSSNKQKDVEDCHADERPVYAEIQKNKDNELLDSHMDEIATRVAFHFTPVCYGYPKSEIENIFGELTPHQVFKNGQSIASNDDITVCAEYFSERYNILRDTIENYKPQKEMFDLIPEYMRLKTWYPQYKKQIIKYWWFARGKDAFAHICLSREPSCIIFAGQEETVRYYSEGLSSLFSNRLYTLKNVNEPINDVGEYFPIQNIFNRHSQLLTLEVERDVSSDELKANVLDKSKQMFAVSVQYDNSEHCYPYFTCPAMNGAFDSKKNPAPIAAINLGFSSPDFVTKITPALDDVGFYGWWVNVGSKASLAELITYFSEHGIVPVLTYEEILHTKEIEIKRIVKLKIPYYADANETSDDIQTHIKNFCVLAIGAKDGKEFDVIIEKVKAMPKGDSVIEISLALLSVANNARRLYPVVSISKNEAARNTGNRSIAEAAARKSAEILYSEILLYDHANEIAEVIESFELLKEIRNRFPSDAKITDYAVVIASHLLAHNIDNDNIKSWLTSLWQDEEIDTPLLAGTIMCVQFHSHINLDSNWKGILCALNDAEIIVNRFPASYVLATGYCRILLNLLKNFSLERDQKNVLIGKLSDTAEKEYDQHGKKPLLYLLFGKILSEENKRKIPALLRQIDAINDFDDEADEVKRIFASILIDTAKEQEPAQALTTLSFLDKIDKYTSAMNAQKFIVEAYKAHCEILCRPSNERVITKTLDEMKKYAISFFNLSENHVFLVMWLKSLYVAMDARDVSKAYISEQLKTLWDIQIQEPEFLEYYILMKIYDALLNEKYEYRAKADFKLLGEANELFEKYLSSNTEFRLRALMLNLFISSAFQFYIEDSYKLWDMANSLCRNEDSNLVDDGFFKHTLRTAFDLLTTKNDGENIENLAKISEDRGFLVDEYALVALIDLAILKQDTLENTIKRIVSFCLKNDECDDEKLIDAISSALYRRGVYKDLFRKHIDLLFDMFENELPKEHPGLFADGIDYAKIPCDLRIKYYIHMTLNAANEQRQVDEKANLNGDM